MTNKEKAIKIIKESMGDDLERAIRCFNGYSPEEMQKRHGYGLKTHQEVLDGYRKDRAERIEVLCWLNGIPS